MGEFHELCLYTAIWSDTRRQTTRRFAPFQSDITLGVKTVPPAPGGWVVATHCNRIPRMRGSETNHIGGNGHGGWSEKHPRHSSSRSTRQSSRSTGSGRHRISCHTRSRSPLLFCHGRLMQIITLRRRGNFVQTRSLTVCGISLERTFRPNLALERTRGTAVRLRVAFRRAPLS